MTERHPNLRLRELLTEAGWSAQDLALAVNALGARTGHTLRYDRTSVAHWQSGTQPRPGVRPLIVRVLGDRLRRGISLADAGLRTDRVEEHATGAVERFLDLAAGDLDPERRIALRHHASPLEELPPPLPGPPRPGRTTGQRRPGVVLYDIASMFNEHLERNGGTFGRTALAAVVAHDYALFAEQARTGHADPQEVWRSGARLGLVLGRMTDDAGYPSLAQRYLLLTCAPADSPVDPTLTAVALGELSALALRLGHGGYALHCAETALRTAVRPPSQVSCFLRAKRALVLARAGQQRPALEDLERAQPAPRAGMSPGPDPLVRFTDTSYADTAGAVWSLLGRPERALAHWNKAVENRPETQRRAQFLTRVHLARTLCGLNRLDEACFHLSVLLGAHPQLHSHLCDVELRALAGRLAPFTRHQRLRRLLPHLQDALDSRRLLCANCRRENA